MKLTGFLLFLAGLALIAAGVVLGERPPRTAIAIRSLPGLP